MHSFPFPYYIVRFKLKDETTEIIGFDGFPYYIVRFKLQISLFPFFRRQCFHTTQYDLNRFSSVLKPVGMFSFHTTQYDLNNILPCISSCVMFSFHTTQYDLNISTFCSLIMPASCFHTTQYDLNSVYGDGYFNFENVSILHSTI